LNCGPIFEKIVPKIEILYDRWIHVPVKHKIQRPIIAGI
jgi:hypothetical protein